jgi:hypothetical protein
VLAQVQAVVPGLVVERLQVAHPTTVAAGASLPVTNSTINGTVTATSQCAAIAKR